MGGYGYGYVQVVVNHMRSTCLSDRNPGSTIAGFKVDGRLILYVQRIVYRQIDLSTVYGLRRLSTFLSK